MNFTRRRFLSRSLFYGTPAVAFGYGSLIEKRLIDVTRTDIPLSGAHSHLDGMKIAVMGDFHHDDFGDNHLIRRAVKAINDEQVDLVMLVGDFVSSDPRALEPLCAELQHLRPNIRSFAVYGNHDRWHSSISLSRMLAEAEIKLLTNEVVEFQEFAVAGLDSVWGGAPDLPRTFAKCPENKPILLGWHEPDTFDHYQDPRVALQMSGHTHGGQVCAPVYGPILLPEYGRTYPYGHYRKEQSSLFVTRGIGTLTIPTRFLCAPEVAILTLRSGRDATAM
ncbi:MAG: metallophosphoesterase [Verrucomicrobiales bacterium]|nr:metallophosphoesterase [Verrucomicrobiales bacterium]